MIDYPIDAIAFHEAAVWVRRYTEDEEGEGEEVGEGGEGVSDWCGLGVWI